MRNTGFNPCWLVVALLLIALMQCVLMFKIKTIGSHDKKANRMMFSSVVLHELVYSLFSLPLSLINVISHNVSEGFLLNCFLNVDGHQNFPRGIVCRELLVLSMSAYIALLYSIWMCSRVSCVYLCVCMYIPPCSCAWDHTCTAVKITSIFGASGPSGY